jgi:thiamine-phosphate pyrophosphorylase
MKPIAECQLYTFVDSAYLRGRPVDEVARALCDGGADLIQLRAKGESVDQILRMAEAILKVAETARVWFVVNDHPAIAGQIHAPLCHLGQDDFFGAGYRHVSEITGTGGSFEIGLSTHAPAQAERAIQAGAVYVAIGPVYATPTKPGRPPVNLDYVRWAAARVFVPWFAIGGINLRNLEDVLAAGARRICVVSAILSAPDIARACQHFKERLTSAAP